MARLLVWLAGTVCFLYALDRIHAWHDLAVFGLLATAGLWIVGGSFVLGRRARGAAPRLGGRAADTGAMRAAAANAEKTASAGVPGEVRR